MSNWQELSPPSKTDRISISQHSRSGNIVVSLAGETAARLKIAKGTALKVEVDLTSPLRQLRITRVANGPFKAAGRVGKSVAVTFGKIAGLAKLDTKVYCEWDENPNTNTLDIELPALWQKRDGSLVVQAGPTSRAAPALARRRG